MDDLDFDELDAKITQEISEEVDEEVIVVTTKKTVAKGPLPPRGTYIDSIRAPRSGQRPLKPVGHAAPSSRRTVVEDQSVQAVSVSRESFSNEKRSRTNPVTTGVGEERTRSEAGERVDIGRKPKPFIAGLKVEKKPLSPHIPIDRPTAIKSTKNVYSSRSVLSPSTVTPPPRIVQPRRNNRNNNRLASALVVLVCLGFGVVAGFLTYYLLLAPHIS